MSPNNLLQCKIEVATVVRSTSYSNHVGHSLFLSYVNKNNTTYHKPTTFRHIPTQLAFQLACGSPVMQQARRNQRLNKLGQPRKLGEIWWTSFQKCILSFHGLFRIVKKQSCIPSKLLKSCMPIINSIECRFQHTKCCWAVS